MNEYSRRNNMNEHASTLWTLATVPDLSSIAPGDLSKVSGHLHDALMDDILRIFRENSSDLTKVTHDLLRIMQERKLISPSESADIADIVDLLVRCGASFALTRAQEAQAKLMRCASEAGYSVTTPSSVAPVIINIAVNSLKRTGSAALPARISWGDIGGAIIGGALGGIGGALAGGVIGSTLLP
jgi:hypothetical protein